MLILGWMHEADQWRVGGMLKKGILLLASLLSMLMASHSVYAETRPAISAASRHALVYIAPKGK